MKEAIIIPPRPFIIFEGRVYAARTVRREEAKTLDSLRDRVERWT